MHGREHNEGGFTLYAGIPDGKNTYYGLSILKMLKEKPRNIDETIRWAENLQKRRVFGLYGKFNLLNILVLLGKEPKIPDKYIKSLIKENKFSNLEIAYLTTVTLKLSGYDKLDHIGEWILSHQNQDGGFGIDTSNIQSTLHALESLNLIDNSLIRRRGDILDFIMRCRTKRGIFTSTPINYPPYIESIYSGIIICEILKKKQENSREIIDFVLKLQNKDGGFRRSIYIGISELEYTFRSLYTLKSLSYLK